MVRFFVNSILLLLAFAMASQAYGQQVIGLSLPFTGRFATVAKNVEFGALVAMQTLSGSDQKFELVIVDDACDDKDVTTATETLVAKQVDIVVGPLCFETAKLLAQGMKGADRIVPIVTLDTRNPLLQRLRDFDELPLFSLSASADAEADAVVSKLLPALQGRPFGLVDDGSVYGRGLADAIRLRTQESGVRPVIVDGFRPLQSTQASLLRRLSKSGIEAVVVAGSAEDVMVIAKDVKRLGYDWLIAGGEQAARVLPFIEDREILPKGSLFVQPTPLPLTPAQLQKLNITEDSLPAEEVAKGYALIEIASQMLNRKLTDPAGETFNTIIGTISFGATGADEARAEYAPFSLFQWDGTALVAAP